MPTSFCRVPIGRPGRSACQVQFAVRGAVVENVRMSTRPLGVLPLEGGSLHRASAVDAPELLVLQRCCWVDEAVANDTLDVPALHETLGDVRAWVDAWTTWCVPLTAGSWARFERARRARRGRSAG